MLFRYYGKLVCKKCRCKDKRGAAYHGKSQRRSHYNDKGEWDVRLRLEEDPSELGR